jgi:hypothetical protein
VPLRQGKFVRKACREKSWPRPCLSSVLGPELSAVGRRDSGVVCVERNDRDEIDGSWRCSPLPTTLILVSEDQPLAADHPADGRRGSEPGDQLIGPGDGLCIPCPPPVSRVPDENAFDAPQALAVARRRGQHVNG